MTKGGKNRTQPNFGFRDLQETGQADVGSWSTQNRKSGLLWELGRRRWSVCGGARNESTFVYLFVVLMYTTDSLPWKGKFLCIYVYSFQNRQPFFIVLPFPLFVIKGRKKSNPVPPYIYITHLRTRRAIFFSQIDRRGQKSTASFNRALSRL